MRWEQIFHSVSDPSWALGMAMQARRVGEAAVPLGKRLLMSFGPILFSAVLSAAGAVFGTIQAVRAEISAEIRTLHEEDLKIRAILQERTTLREQQMAEFKAQCQDAHARIAVLESRQRDAEILAAELRAFMQHERNEFGNSKRK